VGVALHPVFEFTEPYVLSFGFFWSAVVAITAGLLAFLCGGLYLRHHDRRLRVLYIAFVCVWFVGLQAVGTNAGPHLVATDSARVQVMLQTLAVWLAVPVLAPPIIWASRGRPSSPDEPGSRPQSN